MAHGIRKNAQNNNLIIKNMVYNLNTNLVAIFSGTYDTLWNDDSNWEGENNDGVMEYVNYDKWDTKAFMQSIVDAYNNACDLREYLPENIAREIVGVEFTGYYSPREYNFSTDALDFTLTTTPEFIIQLLQVLNDDGIAEWLRENYASRDGFISYTPHTIEGIKDAILNNTNEHNQAIGALLTWLLNKNDEYMGEIEMSVFEEWRGNGYYQPEMTTEQ